MNMLSSNLQFLSKMIFTFFTIFFYALSLNFKKKCSDNDDFFNFGNLSDIFVKFILKSIVEILTDLLRYFLTSLLYAKIYKSLWTFINL